MDVLWCVGALLALAWAIASRPRRPTVCPVVFSWHRQGPEIAKCVLITACATAFVVSTLSLSWWYAPPVFVAGAAVTIVIVNVGHRLLWLMTDARS